MKRYSTLLFSEEFHLQKNKVWKIENLERFLAKEEEERSEAKVSRFLKSCSRSSKKNVKMQVKVLLL